MIKKIFSISSFLIAMSLTLCYATTGYTLKCNETFTNNYGTILAYHPTRTTIATKGTYIGPSNKKICIYVSTYSTESSACATTRSKVGVAKLNMNITIPHYHSYSIEGN